jgi:hypothetical protein
MIVERHTWEMQWWTGVNGVVELIQETWGWLDLPITHRIYTTVTGVGNTVIQEIEFEDFEAREKFWADLNSRPEWGPTLEKWRDLGQVRWTVELLRLVE